MEHYRIYKEAANGNNLTVKAIPAQQQASGEDLDCFPLLLLTMLHWGNIYI